MLRCTLFLCCRARSRRLRSLPSSTFIKGIPTFTFVSGGESTYLSHQGIKESNLILRLAVLRASLPLQTSYRGKNTCFHRRSYQTQQLLCLYRRLPAVARFSCSRFCRKERSTVYSQNKGPVTQTSLTRRSPCDRAHIIVPMAIPTETGHAKTNLAPRHKNAPYRPSAVLHQLPQLRFKS